MTRNSLRFVDNDAETGLPMKRKQTSNACDSCRKRKKRCEHAQGACAHPPLSNGHAISGNDGRTEASPVLSPQLTPTLPLTTQPSTTSQPDPPLFIGDLAPDALLIEATSPDSTRDTSHRGGVGIWHRRSQSVGGAMDSSLRAATFRPSPSLAPPRTGPGGLLDDHVRTECLRLLPPPRHYAALQRIYADKIHPFFPILDLDLLDQAPNLESTVTKQVVALAAATDPNAAPHLYLGAPDNGPPMAHYDFATPLARAIHLALDSTLIPSRPARLRILILLALYVQPASVQESDLPSLLASQAIVYSQSLGLHLTGHSQNDPSFQQTQKDSEHGDGIANVASAVCGTTAMPHTTAGPGVVEETLFCAVWALDRLNGALYGRPCLLHERDFGRDLQACIARQDPPFRLFLSVVEILDRAIDLYRPTRGGVPDNVVRVVDLPVFEAMVIDAKAAKLPSPILATIETFYHAVVILSCRLPPILAAAPQLPPPFANGRRSLAAERIGQVVGHEFAGRLCPVPMVPYAVSLALSVAYRKMRYTRVPMFRSRAKASFAASCALLGGFGERMWSARVLAGMGEAVLREMDRAAAAAAAATNGGGYSDGGVGVEKRTVRGPGTENEAVPVMQLREEAPAAVTPGSKAGVEMPVAGSGTRQPAGNSRLRGEIHHPVGEPDFVPPDATSLQPVMAGLTAGVKLTPEIGDAMTDGQAGGAMNFPLLEGMPDMDVFDRIDPNFNLGVVDAALESTLDVGLPLNWAEWGQFWGNTSDV